MERVGIVVEDLAAAIEFFVELGFKLQEPGPVEDRWWTTPFAGRIVHGSEGLL